ncbi:hypothetical protein G6L30_17225 [Agrobacterium rhizogenes]|nr:hypothetical protein [Rhizobium rhizogenes]
MEISTALGKLFRALQPKKGSVEELSEAYLIACHKCTKHALETVVVKLIRGEIDGVSKSFAPSSAELSAAIRSEMQFVEKQVSIAQERMQIEDNRPVARRPILIEERIQIARQKMADEERKLLLEADSYAAGMTHSRKMPVGSVYSGILCAWYGPPGSLRVPVTQEMLKADMFEPETPVIEPDIPPSPPVEAYADVEF